MPGSGSSPARDTSAILCVNTHLDVDLEATHWCTPVPSKTNFEDDATRLNFGAYQGLYERTRVVDIELYADDRRDMHGRENPFCGARHLNTGV